MGRRRSCWIFAPLVLFSLTLSWTESNNVLNRAAGRLPAPVNLTFQLKNVFTLLWKWKMPSGFHPCSSSLVRFKTEVNSKIKPAMLRNTNMYREVNVHDLDVNRQIHFKVRVECNNETSEWTQMTVFLPDSCQKFTRNGGDREKDVKNFDCVWFNKEYLNCTWEPGSDSLPGTSYTFHYWQKNGEENIDQYARCEQLITGGSPCQLYIYKKGVPLGCHLNPPINITDSSLFLIVIRDQFNTMQFISSVKPRERVKLKPPLITNITRTHNHGIYVNWIVSINTNCLYIDSEIEVTDSNGGVENATVTNCMFSKEGNIMPDLTYTIRVRIKESPSIADSLIWSEWSEVKTVEEGGSGLYILLILILVVLLVMTVVILIYLKRLQLLVCPPIPDPGKVLKKSFQDPGELQQWMKYGKVNVCNKPPKEEICSVILVETPLMLCPVE